MKKFFCASLIFLICTSIFAIEFNVSATVGYSNICSTLRNLSNKKIKELPNIKSSDFYSMNVNHTLLASFNVYMTLGDREEGFVFAVNNDFAFYGVNSINAHLTNRMQDGKREYTIWSGKYGIEGVFWNLEMLLGYTFMFSALSSEPDVYFSILAGLTLGYGNFLALDYKTGDVDVDSFSHANDMGFAGIPISILFQFYFSERFGIAISLTDTPGLWKSKYSGLGEYSTDENLHTDYNNILYHKSKNLGFMNTFHIKIGPTIRF